MVLFVKDELDLFLTSYIRIDSKWIRDLNVKNKTRQELEKNRGGVFFHLSEGKAFLTITQNSEAIQ